MNFIEWNVQKLWADLCRHNTKSTKKKFKIIISEIYTYFYKKKLSENESQKLKNLKKMLRKSTASNAPASIFLEVQKFKKWLNSSFSLFKILFYRHHYENDVYC